MMGYDPLCVQTD